MKNDNVDVYVFIRDAGDSHPVSELMEKLCHTAGVIRTGMNEYVSSLMNVSYNPGQASSQDILQTIRKEGFRASLVGM